MNPGQNWVETNTPFYSRFRDLRVGGLTFQPDTVAWVVTGLLAAALVVHGFGMKKTGRMDGGADFEKIRKWDQEHPEESIGTYANPETGGPVLDEQLVIDNVTPPAKKN